MVDRKTKHSLFSIMLGESLPGQDYRDENMRRLAGSIAQAKWAAEQLQELLTDAEMDFSAEDEDASTADLTPQDVVSHAEANENSIQAMIDELDDAVGGMKLALGKNITEL